MAIVGRPVSRVLQARGYMEVLRVCTDGTRNACSKLYSAAAREAVSRGAEAVITYTRADEGGASLRASNWTQDGETSARSWDCPSRPREDRDERVPRVRWIAPV